MTENGASRTPGVGGFTSRLGRRLDVSMITQKIHISRLVRTGEWPHENNWTTYLACGAEFTEGVSGMTALSAQYHQDEVCEACWEALWGDGDDR